MTAQLAASEGFEAFRVVYELDTASGKEGRLRAGGIRGVEHESA